MVLKAVLLPVPGPATPTNKLLSDSLIFFKISLISLSLFPRFSSIILFAQHFAVFRYRFSSFMPRLNMIRFHFLYLKMLFALSTNRSEERRVGKSVDLGGRRI